MQHSGNAVLVADLASDCQTLLQPWPPDELRLLDAVSQLEDDRQHDPGREGVEGVDAEDDAERGGE